jgi:YqaJ-like viral recombinase domain
MENRKKRSAVCVIESESESEIESDSSMMPLKIMTMLKKPYTVEQCLDMMKLTKMERFKICSMTMEQTRSSDWHAYRFGRITASNVGHLVGAIDRKSYPPSLFKRLDGGDDLSNIPAVKWGLEHELVAIRQFSKSHDYWAVNAAGLLLDWSGILGASPDALLENGGDEAILEVKCPYKHRDSSDLYATAREDTNFCLSPTNGSLKIGHPYWHQVQCQMYVCNVRKAYFVVWTKFTVHWELISADPCWQAIMPGKIRKFYTEIYLPHLIKKYGSSSRSMNQASNVSSDSSSKRMKQV